MDCRIQKPLHQSSCALFLTLAMGWGLTVFCGCGTTKQSLATEQLLLSDAVDTAVARIDFTPLAGQHVYFETKYMQNYKGIGFVNVEYVISSLRQQMTAAGLLLQTNLEDADFIVEGRVGTLGTDSHDVVYGLPSNSPVGAAAAAASTATGAPAISGIPELSVAKRNDSVAAAKIGMFAYERVSREAIWQSGISISRATAKDLWVCGVGPFQRGTIQDGELKFAGSTLSPSPMERREGLNGTIASYKDEMVFRAPPQTGLARARDWAHAPMWVEPASGTIEESRK